MKTIKERAKEYVENLCKARSEFNAKDLEHAYEAGAQDAILTQWNSVTDTRPSDGVCLTRIVSHDAPKPDKSNITVELAPWKDGEYQGGFHMMCYAGFAHVSHWAEIPPFLEKD